MNCAATKIRFIRFLVIIVFLSLFAFSAKSTSQDITGDRSVLREEIKVLSTSKLRSIETVLKRLETRGVIYLPLFDALLNGQLFVRKSDQQIVKLVQDKNGKRIEEDLFSGEKRRIESGSEYKKIRINNRLRAQLKKIILWIGMQSRDYEIRKSSISDMIGKFQKEDIVRLRELTKQEEEQSILELLEFAIALHEVKHSQILDIRIEALAKISDRLFPAVKKDSARPTSELFGTDFIF